MADEASEEGSSTAVPDPEMLKQGPGAFLGDTDDESALEPVCRFLGKYVKYLHGENAIKKYVDINKGRTFLDMLTPSNVAYSISIVKNNEEVWKEQYEVAKNPNLRDKYKDKKNKEYVYKKPRYTGGPGQKRQFGRVMWQKEGTAFMINAKEVWRKAFKDDRVKILLQKAWEKYSKANDDVASQYHQEKETEKVLEEEEEEDEVILEDDSDDDQGFMAVSSSVQKGGIVESEEQTDVVTGKRNSGDAAESGKRARGKAGEEGGKSKKMRGSEAKEDNGRKRRQSSKRIASNSKEAGGGEKEEV